MAHCGVASRRHAEDLVRSGRVSVGGRRVLDPALDVAEGDDVKVDGRPVAPEPSEYYLLNKPPGVVSTAHDPQGRPKVTDLVPSNLRLYPVGRLDVSSSGLVLLTNDGELANRLTHPRFEVERAYLARVKGSVKERALRELRNGVELDDGRTAPAKARILERHAGGTLLELTLREGRNRQVRRMCEAVGHPVRALERTRFGPLELGRLKTGSARKLRREEVERLKVLAGDPSPRRSPPVGRIRGRGR
jgi:23S rRNA pseudouridine2605 synthase